MVDLVPYTETTVFPTTSGVPEVLHFLNYESYFFPDVI